MKKILFIPMVFIELFLIALNWIVAVINPKLGKKMMEWNLKTLPDKEWYS